MPALPLDIRPVPRSDTTSSFYNPSTFSAEKPFWEQIDSSRFLPVYTKTCLRPKTANSNGTIYLLFIFLARARRGYSKAFFDTFINWIGMMYDDF